MKKFWARKSEQQGMFSHFNAPMTVWLLSWQWAKLNNSFLLRLSHCWEEVLQLRKLPAETFWEPASRKSTSIKTIFVLVLPWNLPQLAQQDVHGPFAQLGTLCVWEPFWKEPNEQVLIIWMSDETVPNCKPFLKLGTFSKKVPKLCPKTSVVTNGFRNWFLGTFLFMVSFSTKGSLLWSFSWAHFFHIPFVQETKI